MSTTESQDIEQATASIQPQDESNASIQAQPDSKTRRYDRQLRLWAASGQAALESSRILLLSASATSTAILKNLVLPGIGHFTLLDDASITPADVGNNFFLPGLSSLGKPRSAETVPLLRELNENVSGEAVVKSVDEVLGSEDGREWVRGFSLVIAHNLPREPLVKLADLLWEDNAGPALIAVRSAGFLADFFIQFHEHCITEPHSESLPSLRVSHPFPALLEWAQSLDWDNMDPTEHAHIPFAVILVHAVENWKAQYDGSLPKTYAEKQAFKLALASLKKKLDEENFEEAEAQAWRVWSETPVPAEVSGLFEIPLDGPDKAFHALVKTLQRFVSDPRGNGWLPLTSTLPDMRTDTESYVRLQTIYKKQAAVEKARFKELLTEGFPEVQIDEERVDLFVKNAHHVKVLKGKRWGAWDEDSSALAASFESFPKETATHLALSALSILLSRTSDPSQVTVEALTQEIQTLVGESTELPKSVDDAVGEIARAPTAELPNTAAFLGGMVAQEAIKIITAQYVPVNGYCVIDLVDSWTGVVG